jgi:hypothetical protein
MPAHLKSDDAVESYRKYYATHKSYFASWKNGDPPWWKKSVQDAIRDGIVNEKSLSRAIEIATK